MVEDRVEFAIRLDVDVALVEPDEEPDFPEDVKMRARDVMECLRGGVLLVLGRTAANSAGGDIDHGRHEDIPTQGTCEVEEGENRTVREIIGV